MKIRHLAIPAVFIITSALTASSFAGDASERFSQLDADGDGAISLEEATVDPNVADAWGSIDANQDGKLESAEFSAYEEQSKEAGQ